MADVKWIKIVTDVFDNRKIRQIELMPDADTILVIWFKLLCLAGNINESGLLIITKDIPYNDEMLANQFSRPINTIRLALDTFMRFGMIEMVDDVLCVSNWEKYQSVEKLDKIREQTRARVAKHRENQRLLSGNVTVTQCNATEEDKNKNKDIYSAFEDLWTLYPNKKGKGQITDSVKKKIFPIREEFERCIERYVKYVEGERERGFKDLKFQNGSTFFRSGYVDYLDENYKEKSRKSTALEVNAGDWQYD